MEEEEDTGTKADQQVALCSHIKSSAVVKYASLEMPAKFQELQRNTDLNQPPSNWLHGHSKWESYLRDISFGKEHSFSSFKIAHCYPEITGEIDVVSDAENIKKLLKIPYSKSPVSMMVHRVGNTLLLEDFDVHRHLLRKQQDDWKWLRKFYYETIVRNMQDKQKDKCVVKKNKSRDHLQNRNMFSKFLYYSMQDAEEEESDKSKYLFDSSHFGMEDLSEASTQGLPDPLSKTEHEKADHQRNVIWTFEDIRMLIGTDLPIFGGSTHPCVSLRLRDRDIPVNVLTGLDYWLDNLMCNVPELAMCYHLSGIVQSYELIKTEDIPNLENSKFSPSVVKDIAQNILSFLKASATKEGHTYWLFKGQEDDVIKLYDLTTLCSDMMDDQSDNPFTVPVGMLLYRVARNMRQRIGRKKSGTIRTLLNKCLLLLDSKKHSQVVTSAHLLLSDLYVSDNIYNVQSAPSVGTETESDSDSDEAVGEGDQGEDDLHAAGAKLCSRDSLATSLEVRALCLPETVKNRDLRRAEVSQYPPIDGSAHERCREALQHIVQGLSIMEGSMKADDQENPASSAPYEVQAQCNPSEAIPLHYEPIRKDSLTTASSPSKPDPTTSGPAAAAADGEAGGSADSRLSSDMVRTTRLSLPPRTWQVLSQALLYRKAAIAYYGLAETEVSEQKYGAALRCLKYAVTCLSAMKHILPSKAEENLHVLSAILGLAGDVHLMLTRRDAAQLLADNEDFLDSQDSDLLLMKDAEKHAVQSECGLVQELSGSMVSHLQASVVLYELSLDHATACHESLARLQLITKRCANAHNELGVHYMNQAAALLSEAGGVGSKQIQDLWEKSANCFSRGISAFQSLEDSVNMALLLSNRGRLMRLCAKGQVAYDDTGQNRQEFSAQERVYFNKAQESYLQAIGLLEKRETCPEIWDSISWELSSTCFQMATLLQDFAPLSTSAMEQVESEVSDLMAKALLYCAADTLSPRQMSCQYRAATIHHRLASLHHNAYRNLVGDGKRRQLREATELHYAAACRYFSLVQDSPCELMRVQLERVALCEYQLTNQTSAISRTRTLHQALGYLLECRTCLATIQATLVSDEVHQVDDQVQTYCEEAGKLLGILESRLQYVLLNLVKNVSLNKKSKSSPELNRLHKAMYAASLQKPVKVDGPPDLLTRCRHQIDVIDGVSQLRRQIETLNGASKMTDSGS